MIGERLNGSGRAQDTASTIGAAAGFGVTAAVSPSVAAVPLADCSVVVAAPAAPPPAVSVAFAVPPAPAPAPDRPVTSLPVASMPATASGDFGGDTELTTVGVRVTAMLWICMPSGVLLCRSARALEKRTSAAIACDAVCLRASTAA